MVTSFTSMNQAVEHAIEYLENVKTRLEQNELIVSDAQIRGTLNELEKECHDLSRFVSHLQGQPQTCNTVEANLKEHLFHLLDAFQKSPVLAQKMGSLQQRFFKSFRQMRHIIDRTGMRVTKTEQEGTRT
jgi:hypothetical protein